MSFVSTKRMTFFDVVNYTFLMIISGLCILPFVYVLLVSLTASEVYVPFQLNIIPDQWSLEAYTYILSTHTFLNALQTTVFITVVGTILNLVFTFTMAYALTDRQLPHYKLIWGVVIFALVFNAGIIPNFLLVRELGLLNSEWALILPLLTNSWSLIVVKSFLDSLPNELQESAKIDGCNDIGVFLRIILPLSKPAIATFTLFFAVTHWNTYFHALIYLTDTSKWTLQVLVQSLVLDSNVSAGMEQSIGDAAPPSETIRLAAVVLSMLPILCVYPFLQKHFAKGVMLGSIKG